MFALGTKADGSDEECTRARGSTIALAHSAANLHHKVKVVLRLYSYKAKCE